MKSKLLFTTGNGEFQECDFIVPEIEESEIQVNAVFTGVCRSDIDMMQGSFGPLPLNMQGHEGLGQVTKIGKNILDVKVGDYVATRGEPAYSNIYNVRSKEYVKVPSADPKYILEPVACGINVVMQAQEQIANKGPGKKVLILGSGFLAWVAYQTLLITKLASNITVIGNSNKHLWKDVLKQTIDGQFDVVIDLSSNTKVFDEPILNNEALIIFGAQKQVNTDFSNLLWKACTMIFPSPRTNKFYDCMVLAEQWITNEQLNIDNFWTRGYNRETEWKDAFTDGLKRSPGYSRGYIYWK